MAVKARLRWSRAVGLLHLLIVTTGCVVLIGTYGIRIVEVIGVSMAPTLNDGDRMLVDEFDYALGDPHVGDIVVLYYPVNPARLFIKRVIAAEGDTVRVTNGRTYVNGLLIPDDEYVPVSFRSHDDLAFENVAPGHYFVMGDHRNNSSDSRDWGLVPRRYILGKVKLRLWPIDKATIF
ncbi:MAG TPA: signal peptidase I [Vicinamibacterales bacterium]